MIHEADFDALSRKARESGGALENLNALAGAIFALPKWCFIARGELPNINPYVASRADYEDGMQMIRAFTDSERLARFAKENNLTDADGSAQMLEVPVAGIVAYLEQFINEGVYGVWFNSDRDSDGFSFPLAQLRPIQEHLAKLAWTAAGTTTGSHPTGSPGAPTQSHSQKTTGQNIPLKTVAIIIKDGLKLQSGFVKPGAQVCNLYCLVPADWTEGTKLKEKYLEKFFEKMYGDTWRMGNSDGSRYVVEHSYTAVLTPEELKGMDWTNSLDDEKNYFWYFIGSEDGSIRKAAQAEFQQVFDASQKAAVSGPSAPGSQTSGPGERGHSGSSEGGTDANIKIYRTGNVAYGTSAISFYTAIVTLLPDYRGSGEYQNIFTFTPEAMQNLKESFGSNAHGAYFRLRTFQYASPNAAGDATTIDSNVLRHINTGAALLISFVLLQIPAASSTALYFRFEGPGDEVRKLEKAVAPALEAAQFVEYEAK